MSEPDRLIEEENENAADPGTELQFDEAEPLAPTPSGPSCAACKRLITDAYYEINGKVVCTSCRTRIEASFRGGSAAGRVIKAAVFGAGAAVGGAVLYFAIGYVTGANIGLVAVVVGFIVGRAVRKGSENRGGLLYQFLALFLTYTAVGLMLIVTIATMKGAAPPAPAHGPAPPWVYLLNTAVAVYSLPVIAGVVSPISGLIYCFALFEAWRINKRARLAFNGPFQISDAPAPATSAPGVMHDGE